MRPVTFAPGAALTKVSTPSTLPSLAGCSTATARVTGPVAALAAGDGAVAPGDGTRRGGAAHLRAGRGGHERRHDDE